MILRVLVTALVIATCGVGCDRGCNEPPAPRMAVPRPAPPAAEPAPLATVTPTGEQPSPIAADASSFDAAAIGRALPLAMPIPLGHDIYRLADGRCQLVVQRSCPPGVRCEAPPVRFVPCP